MWLQNVEGSGARLSFELPIEAGAVITPRDSAIHPTARPLSVLIVEDLEPLRRGISLMTERLGHTALPMTGYADAHQRLATTPSGIEAILLDVHLEDGHTGFELFHELEHEGRGRERLVVFTTGDSISPETRDHLERADRPVLRKPFSLSDLRAILDRLS
jgi:CheY-like chemotaxis protein